MKQELTEQLQPGSDQREEQEDEEHEEGDLDVTIEGAEEDEEEGEISELWDSEPSLSQPDVQVSEDQRKRAGVAAGAALLLLLLTDTGSSTSCRNNRCPQNLVFSPSSLCVAQVGLDGTAPCTRQQRAVQLQQKRAELQERLMVSEATVQVQAEQLKDYRQLLSELSHTHTPPDQTASLSIILITSSTSPTSCVCSGDRGAAGQ